LISISIILYQFFALLYQFSLFFIQFCSIFIQFLPFLYQIQPQNSEKIPPYAIFRFLNSAGSQNSPNALVELGNLLSKKPENLGNLDEKSVTLGEKWGNNPKFSQNTPKTGQNTPKSGQNTLKMPQKPQKLPQNGQNWAINGPKLPNYASAIAFYRKAAEMGSAEALFNMGFVVKMALGGLKWHFLALNVVFGV
jgi:TPR repeat protein